MNYEMKRDIWVDNVKVVACVFVVLGHFFQSMVKANIIEDNFLYEWFNTTIYYFHVPLFFICSGYLYQKYSCVSNLQEWKNNILKKFVALGVPYFVFSILTWGLKKANSSAVNTQIGGVVDTLFRHPASPYWYLYILFFIFVITCTAKENKHIYLLLSMSVICKVVSLMGFYLDIYAVDKLLSEWVWFVLGMAIARRIISSVRLITSVVLIASFAILSVMIQIEMISIKGIKFPLGIMACFGIIGIMQNAFKEGTQSKYWGFFAKYTMPIFLMHTLFAAPLRSVLIKMGVHNSIIHILLGVMVSFIGPVVAMIVMDKIKPLDFLVYPTRYTRFEKKLKEAA
ncbi:acyltransferase family protein [Butyrivibrio sp. AE3004]|uniref:acyltransferase family protein n=1 Tax=Butyrivibrio sp. AE3004 TaxID=1506994 RepID=UPI0004949CE6|nr:acyltransferase [Butyrivibrio sp. AE3004]